MVFLESLGSISFFIILQIFYILLSLIASPCLHLCPLKWVKNQLSSSVTWDSSLTFVHSTFFEVSICAAISLGELQYWKILIREDKMSVGATFFCLAFLLSYLFLGIYFFCYRAGELVIKKREQIEEENLRSCDFLHESLLFQAKHKGFSDE